MMIAILHTIILSFVLCIVPLWSHGFHDSQRYNQGSLTVLGGHNSFPSNSGWTNHTTNNSTTWTSPNGALSFELTVQPSSGHYSSPNIPVRIPAPSLTIEQWHARFNAKDYLVEDLWRFKPSDPEWTPLVQYVKQFADYGSEIFRLEHRYNSSFFFKNREFGNAIKLLADEVRSKHANIEIARQNQLNSVAQHKAQYDAAQSAAATTASQATTEQKQKIHTRASESYTDRIKHRVSAARETIARPVWNLKQYYFNEESQALLRKYGFHPDKLAWCYGHQLQHAIIDQTIDGWNEWGGILVSQPLDMHSQFIMESACDMFNVAHLITTMGDCANGAQFCDNGYTLLDYCKLAGIHFYDGAEETVRAYSLLVEGLRTNPAETIKFIAKNMGLSAWENVGWLAEHFPLPPDDDSLEATEAYLNELHDAVQLCCDDVNYVRTQCQNNPQQCIANMSRWAGGQLVTRFTQLSIGAAARFAIKEARWAINEIKHGRPLAKPGYIGADSKTNKAVRTAEKTVAKAEETVTKQIQVRENTWSHIFTKKRGHFSTDTPENRKMIIDLVSDSKNFLGTDNRGFDSYAKTLNNGQQVWAYVYDGYLKSGGLNEIPKEWNSITGLSALTKPMQNTQKL